jgi:hypothetical protein
LEEFTDQPFIFLLPAMKRILFLICWLLSGFAFTAEAGKILGTDLTYSTIAPNIVAVTYKVVRDCDSLPPDPVVNLLLSSPGCSAGRVVLLNRVGTSQSINPLCPGSPPLCSGTGQGVVIFTYVGVVSFSASEAACFNWYMSVLIPGNSRTATANLTGTSNSYAEAYLRLGNNFSNNSSEFSAQNVPFTVVLHNIQANIALNAWEPDGDSVVYELQPVLSGFNTPVSYQSGFSAVAPVPSSSAFTLDPISGQLTLKPSVYMPNSPRKLGNNRYAVVVRVKEYRRISGVTVLVGYVRREMAIEVNENNFNPVAPPVLVNPTVNGQLFNLIAPLNILAGQTSIIQAGSADPDTLENINMQVVGYFSPGFSAQVANNFSRHPMATITLNPPLSDAGTTKFIQIKLEDDDCPVKGISNYVLEVRINSPTGINPGQDQENRITAYPNPFREELNFRLGSNSNNFSELVIYNLLGQEVDRLIISPDSAPEIRSQKVPQLPAGQYLVKIQAKDGTSQTLKISRLP